MNIASKLIKQSQGPGMPTPEKPIYQNNDSRNASQNQQYPQTPPSMTNQTHQDQPLSTEAQMILMGRMMSANPIQYMQDQYRKNPHRPVTLEEAYEGACKKQINSFNRMARSYSKNMSFDGEDPTNSELVSGIGLVDLIYRELQAYPKHEVRKLVNLVWSYVLWQLMYGTGKCRTPIGTFKLNYRGPRVIRSISDGQLKRIPGQYVIKFSASKNAKEAVNQYQSR